MDNGLLALGLTVLVVVVAAVASTVAYRLGLGAGTARGTLEGEARAEERARKLLGSAEERAKQLTAQAEEARAALVKKAELEAREAGLKVEREAQESLRARREELEKELAREAERLRNREQQLERKQHALDTRLEDVQRQRDDVEKVRGRIELRESEVERRLGEVRAKLEQTAGLSSEEARKALTAAVEAEARLDAAKRVRHVEEEAREEAESRAKRIVGMAIQRYAGEYVAERTISTVTLPNDEMKGRIIGREGRNIRALEQATGVDLIVDDTPEAVVISGFDPVRREVARLALESLVADGRIHPSRIEEAVDRARQQVDKSIKDAGERACIELGLTGVHPEVQRLVGRLRYRTSYTQNQWQHSVEVAFICGAMASELGVNVKQARRAGLLHDIGKALTHEQDGSHAVIGADYAKRYDEHPDILHCIRCHHLDEEPRTLLAHLTMAADAVSGARPGARREHLENYVQRLEELERIANGFAGVERSFAVQAGREVRVLVESDKVTDEAAVMLSRDIAKMIESEMTYPGQIKVTVIRETRVTEYAR
ncbi:MAG: ribonuclease Y [Myxococcota bacterium]